MSVLVDTSIWIRFLAGREPYASGLDRLLQRDEVIGHELVYGELLIGDRGGRSTLLHSYEKIVQSAKVPHVEVVTFVREHRLYGLGIGWIDANLLASTIVDGFRLWAHDTHLVAVADTLNVAYVPGE